MKTLRALKEDDNNNNNAAANITIVKNYLLWPFTPYFPTVIETVSNGNAVMEKVANIILPKSIVVLMPIGNGLEKSETSTGEFSRTAYMAFRKRNKWAQAPSDLNGNKAFIVEDTSAFARTCISQHKGNVPTGVYKAQYTSIFQQDFERLIECSSYDSGNRLREAGNDSMTTLSTNDTAYSKKATMSKDGFSIICSHDKAKVLGFRDFDQNGNPVTPPTNSFISLVIAGGCNIQLIIVNEFQEIEDELLGEAMPWKTNLIKWIAGKDKPVSADISDSRKADTSTNNSGGNVFKGDKNHFSNVKSIFGLNSSYTPPSERRLYETDNLPAAAPGTDISQSDQQQTTEVATDNNNSSQSKRKTHRNIKYPPRKTRRMQQTNLQSQKPNTTAVASVSQQTTDVAVRTVTATDLLATQTNAQSSRSTGRTRTADSNNNHGGTGKAGAPAETKGDGNPQNWIWENIKNKPAENYIALLYADGQLLTKKVEQGGTYTFGEEFIKGIIDEIMGKFFKDLASTEKLILEGVGLYPIFYLQKKYFETKKKRADKQEYTELEAFVRSPGYLSFNNGTKGPNKLFGLITDCVGETTSK